MSNKRLTKHIAVLTTLLLIVVCGAYGLWCGVRYLQAQEQSLMIAQERIAAYEENKKIFTDETIALDALTQRISVDETLIITSTTTPNLLSSLEALAQKHAVEFTITAAQNSGKQKDRLVIDFSASGTSIALDAFLEDLSRQTYQVKFTKLSLYADEGAKWNALGSIQIMSFGL